MGVFWGLSSSLLGLNEFTLDWIKPFGTIFLNLLKLIAVPLVVVSLIQGVSGLSDVSKLSRIGTKSIALYMVTTVIAVCTGLVLVNVARPGESFSDEKRNEFKEKFAQTAQDRAKTAQTVQEAGPLQFLEDTVPTNIFNSLTDNTQMLQIIFFALMFGVSLVLIPPDKAKPVFDFFDGTNAIILKMVDLIMKFSPYGVFALLAGLVVDFAGDSPADAVDLLAVLGYYSLVVIAGLLVMMFVVYPLMVTIITKQNYLPFLKGMIPAHMLAFSTSSSAATLPVTMDCVENNLGVSKEISSFVLPLGATINMDGTSLYQAVAAVFIAQAFGMELDLAAQLGIVLTATLASIGTAAVPGAGTVMLVIVLQQTNIPIEGIALIFAVDRLLDMCRTVINVTGDAAVATIISHSEGKLRIPKS